MFKRKISTVGLILAVFLCSLFLSGCSEKPLLTQDGSYVIVSLSPSGMTTGSELIELPWNTNMAIMRKLLLESSFVLSDLHTPIALSSSINGPLKKAILQTTILKTNFAEPRPMSFLVDQKVLNLDVESLQIEVEGVNVGQVTLNQTIKLQGINNPNLQPAYAALRDMLHDNN